MLKEYQAPERPEKEELKRRLSKAREQLAAKQMQVKEHKLPVVVLMEGWGTAGKGSTIGKIIPNLDPRFFKVASLDIPTEDEKRKPFLYRYFAKLPKAGNFLFMDSGWMDETVKGRLYGTESEKTYASRIESICRFERQLTDNGYLVVKFFLHISRKEQRRRMDGLLCKKDTRWRVSENDKWQNKHYGECLEIFDQYLKETDAPGTPWYIIDAMSAKWVELQILELLNSALEVAFQNHSLAVPLLQNHFPLVKMAKLSEISLDKKVEPDQYKIELKALQARLRELHNRLYRKRVPVVICYEGWDAAGKGGNIKRITEALDPRGYEVHPIASPEPH